MTAPRCSRCGQPFEYRTPTDTRCVQCQKAVDLLIAADALRRAPRFPQAKDLTEMTGIVL